VKKIYLVLTLLVSGFCYSVPNIQNLGVISCATFLSSTDGTYAEESKEMYVLWSTGYIDGLNALAVLMKEKGLKNKRWTPTSDVLLYTLRRDCGKEPSLTLIGRLFNTWFENGEEINL
tara:strand:+ start:834 stop:1187 length:354 start_codon:yes stop_codon:yes gene_type:complete